MPPPGDPPPVPAATRAYVYDRAGHRCEYCKLTAILLHPDHVTPWSRWTGTPAAYNHPDNLAAACYQCNSIKQDRVDGIDPLTGQRRPLFNPRSAEPWTDHFRWSDDYLEIVPISAVGRATMAVLRLNRRAYRAHRLLLRRAWQGGHDPWP